MRRLIAALEWLLRLLIFNRRLPAVRALLRDLSYGDHPKHRLDIVVPAGNGPFPMLVYVHGGAWVTGDKANFAWVTHSFAHGGALVVSLNYRWAPEAGFAEQLSDIANAVRWARQRAPEYGGDPERMFLAGDSAGAHLVCWLHMALRQPELLQAANVMLPFPPDVLRGSLLFYGIYDLEVTWKLGASVRTPIRSLLGAEPAAVPELTKLASPLRHIVPGVAPLFVAAGEKDVLYGQSVELVDSLCREGLENRPLLLDRKRYSDAGHSFINFGSRKAARASLQGALAFIAEFDRG